MRRRRLKEDFLKHLIAFLWIAAIWNLTGCGRAPGRADLVIVNGAEPETLDPAIVTGQPEARVVNALFEGLTAFDRSGRPVPGVAESWDILEGGRLYRFYLRKDAKWSDGRPVSAHDFLRSWRRVLLPEAGSAYQYLLFCVRGARDFAEGRLNDFGAVGIRAVGPLILEVELESPIPYFLALCAFATLAPVPTELVEKLGEDWIKPGKIVGNGAFVLREWRINDRIRLERNEHYWGRTRVALRTVDFLPISKDSTAFNFYESGLADVVMDKGLVPAALLDELKRRDDFHSAPFLGVYFLRFNCSKEPFSDVRVRRAFALAVDKRLIVEKITRAGELPAGGFVPPGLEGYGGCDGLPYDPELARQLLRKAGYPGGRRFPVTVFLFNESQQNESIAVELREMWQRELGVGVQLTRQEWKVYLNSLSSLDYGIARSSWVGDYPDSNTFLDMFVTGGGNNRTGWSHAGYDGLIEAASFELDAKRRTELLERAERLLVEEEAPIVPLYFYVGTKLFDPKKIGGIELNLLDEHPVREIYRRDARDASVTR